MCKTTVGKSTPRGTRSATSWTPHGRRASSAARAAAAARRAILERGLHVGFLRRSWSWAIHGPSHSSEDVVGPLCRRLLRRDHRCGAAPARFGLNVGGLRVFLDGFGERGKIAHSRTSDSRSARESNAHVTRERRDTYTPITGGAFIYVTLMCSVLIHSNLSRSNQAVFFLKVEKS